MIEFSEIILVCAAFASSTNAFNVDTESPIVVLSPNYPKSLFGYSLALEKSGTLYVGAPDYKINGAVFR